MAQKVRETVHYLSSPKDVREGLFIGEVMGLITMPLIPLTTYPSIEHVVRG
jgi:hypothetical protein